MARSQVEKAEFEADPTDDVARERPRAPDLARLGLVWRAILLAAAVLLLAYLISRFGGDVLAWARETQRSVQGDLARAVNAVRKGDGLALATLLGASFFYGFAHAVGPGHGKLLIAGAATASRRTARRMAAIGFFASLTQALSAILLAYGALGLFSLTGRAASGLAEKWLAPLSAAAVALVGVWLLVRGLRGLAATMRADRDLSHSHDHHGCGAGCRHAPSAQEAERAESWAETLSLVFSIGLRPCSGALIVLAIAWNFQLYFAGMLSALAMAVGTGAVVAGVAVFAAGFRDAQALGGSDIVSRRLFAWVQVAAGLGVALLSGLVAAASL